MKSVDEVTSGHKCIGYKHVPTRPRCLRWQQKGRVCVGLKDDDVCKTICTSHGRRVDIITGRAHYFVICEKRWLRYCSFYISPAQASPYRPRAIATLYESNETSGARDGRIDST